MDAGGWQYKDFIGLLIKSSSIRGAPKNTESFDDAPQKASNRLIMHPKSPGCIIIYYQTNVLMESCLIVLKNPHSQTIRKKMYGIKWGCRGICISGSCGTLPVQKEHGWEQNAWCVFLTDGSIAENHWTLCFFGFWKLEIERNTDFRFGVISSSL